MKPQQVCKMSCLNNWPQILKLKKTGGRRKVQKQCLMKEIERHFGKDIIKLDAEVGNLNKPIVHHDDLECFQDVDEIEKLTKD